MKNFRLKLNISILGLMLFFCLKANFLVYAQSESEVCGTIPKTDEEMDAMPWVDKEDDLYRLVDSVRFLL